jgi:hypothetical protein
MKYTLTCPINPVDASPGKRSSRSQGLKTNKSFYASFEKKTSNCEQSEVFKLGDAVVISSNTHLPLVVLNQPPQWKKFKSTKKNSSQASESWGFNHDDGLAENEKVAIIKSIYQDEAGAAKMIVRWCLRPRYVYSIKGPEDDSIHTVRF